MLDAVAELVGDEACVIAEAHRRVARFPAAFLVERLRQVPMEERGVRRDVGFEQRVGEAAVIVEAFVVRLPPPVGSTRDQEIEKR